MNAQERGILARLYHAIQEVPFAHNGQGTVSASVAGMVKADADLRHLRRCEVNTLLHLLSGEMEEAEFEINDLEGWIIGRTANDWK